MKNIWRIMGISAFWLSLPLLHIYLRSRRRTRVLVVCGEEVLVVKGWLSNGKWHLPGGGLHLGEPSATGAIREVLEETGLSLDATALQSLGETKYSNHGLRFTYDRFIVEVPSKQPIRAQRGEILDVCWMPIPSLTGANAEPDVLGLLRSWQGLRQFGIMESG